MPKRLLIAAEADGALVERAKADARFDVVDHQVRTEDELAAIVGDCEILVTRSYNRVTRRVIDAAPRLELIAQGTSGTDNIDAEAATARGIPSYVAVEESMACGIGVCMTCVLPVVGEDGRTRFSRSCVEGPVFGGVRVRFADVGTLPWDVVGAD